nr:calcium-binding protein [Propionivibrio sp.]
MLGGAGNDVLLAGDYTTYYHAGMGYTETGTANILEGGTGTDQLWGSGGSDTYRYKLGDGADTINEVAYANQRALDTGTDRIVLGAGIAPADVTVSRSGNNLVLKFANAGDQITINAWIDNRQRVEQLQFADGTIWTAAELTNRSMIGSDAADIIEMWADATSAQGRGGNDTIIAGASISTLSGGQGDDSYAIDIAGDVVVEAAGEGVDLVRASVSYTLAANVENLTLTGTAAINGTGNALDNVLTGNSAANVLTGAAGNDSYVVDNAGDIVVEAAGEGVDLVQTSVSYTLAANVENLTLTGTAAINGTGNALDNVLTGNSAVNTLRGGLGNDTYVVDNTGDIVVEALGEGVDLVRASVSYTLAANVENLTLTGTAAINGTGNALDNVLTGNSAANTLSGGAGADTLRGGLGNDTFVVDNAGDIVSEALNEGTDLVQASISYTLAANVENLTLTGTAAINATGNTLNNVLTGNSAANTLTGGLGNDTYVIGAGDVVIEALNEGTDLVQSSISYTLADNVENLTLTGTAAINATGNALDNVLTGNSAANILAGGLGSDTYVVGAGDVVIEALNAGTDLVQASVSYTLTDNVENLTLTGTSAINGTGNTQNNILAGNSAANSLDGGSGADSMLGGAGNDSYVVDNTGDVVSENLNAGTDLVQSSISYTLTDNVENLTLTGATAINATGNALNNVLTGNSAANTLTGGLGNDIYVVDAGDVVIEALNAGTDLVQASISYTLTDNVENLTLTGAAAIDGVGNALNNVLTGNSAANTLAGGLGNDTYVVGAGDVVIEALNAGTDLVQASVSYALTDNVENLTLTGATAINATGNALNNMLTGNSAANMLIGGAGNDALNGGAGADILEGGVGNDALIDTAGNALFDGGAGADTLTGGAGAEVFLGGLGNDTLNTGAGNDVILFNKGDGQDTVLAGGTGSDTLSLGGNFAYNDLTFSKASNDLVLKVSADDKLTFNGWYAALPSRPIVTLQIVAEALAGYAEGGADPLLNHKVETFDFTGLVAAFDAARAADSNMSSWTAMHALLDKHLAASNSAALGGDLAYQYGNTGSLGGVGLIAAQQLIGDPHLGTGAQTLKTTAQLQEGVVRL